jgi:hypothetical protein
MPCLALPCLPRRAARNRAYMRGTGADRVIDYSAKDIATEASDCDEVFDTSAAMFEPAATQC